MRQVVFGAGPVGWALSRLLDDQGHDVTTVTRSGAGPEGVTAVAGDAGDPAFVTSVLRGAEVAYQCLNPPYTAWPEGFPPLQRSLLEGSRAAGTKLVSFETLSI